MYGSIAGHQVEGIETCAISHVLVSESYAFSHL